MRLRVSSSNSAVCLWRIPIMVCFTIVQLLLIQRSKGLFAHHLPEKHSRMKTSRQKQSWTEPSCHLSVMDVGLKIMDYGSVQFSMSLSPRELSSEVQTTNM